MSFSIDKFIKEKSGKTLGFPSGQYVGECLSLVKIYIQERFDIYPPASGCDAARCYWTKFPHPLGTVLKKVPNLPDLIPLKGWIPVWSKEAGGGYGHTGIVVEADVNKFTSLDQNWNGRQAHLVVHNYDNVLGFLVPIKEEVKMAETPLEACERNKTKFWGERDVFHRALGVDTQRKAVNALNKLQEDVKVYKEKVEELEKNQEPDCAKQIAAYKGEVTKKETLIAQLEAKLAIKQKNPVDESLRETGRQVISWAVGLGVAYAFNNIPGIENVGIEQSAVITTLTAFGVRYLDKYLHTKGKNSSDDVLVGGLFRF